MERGWDPPGTGGHRVPRRAEERTRRRRESIMPPPCVKGLAFCGFLRVDSLTNRDKRKENPPQASTGAPKSHTEIPRKSASRPPPPPPPVGGDRAQTPSACGGEAVL